MVAKIGSGLGFGASGSRVTSNMRGDDVMDRDTMTSVLQDVVIRCKGTGPVNLALYATKARVEEFQGSYNKAAIAALRDQGAEWSEEEKDQIIQFMAPPDRGHRGGMETTIPATRCTSEERMLAIQWAGTMGQSVAAFIRESLFVYSVPPEIREEIEARAKRAGEPLPVFWGKMVASFIKYG